MLVAPKTQIGPQLPDELRDDDHDDGEVQEDGEVETEADRSIYTNGIGDSRGFYEDGAYIGVDEDEFDEEYNHDEAHDEEEEASRHAVHEAYFAAVMDQYTSLRKALQKRPPPGAEKSLSTQAIFAAPFGRNSPTNRVWSQLLRNSDPSPVQVALMTKDTVVRVLRVLLGGKFLRRGHPMPERTSRWLWALLARLPERGELNYSEIGWIRDLGRRAVLLGRSLSEMAALREELADGGLGVNDAVDASSSDEDVVAAETTFTEEYPDTDAEESGATVPDADSKKKVNGETQPVEDEADEPMDLETNRGDVDADEGEITDKEQKLEAAKQGLLAALEHTDSEDEDNEQAAARERSRMNMRATLNMILTVAGEFYGQRDLLEFREPFVGM